LQSKASNYIVLVYSSEIQHISLEERFFPNEYFVTAENVKK